MITHDVRRQVACDRHAGFVQAAQEARRARQATGSQSKQRTLLSFALTWSEVRASRAAAARA